MRYIGNKTRLIPFLLEAVDGLGTPPGVACDPFAGTASVARALKSRGWRVHAGDLMASSYALQVARVELDRTPRFRAGLIDAEDNGSSRSGGRARVSYKKLLAWLDQLPAKSGFLTEHFTPAGQSGAEHGRMYFTPENAQRIDTMREVISEWKDAGLRDPPHTEEVHASELQSP